MILGLRISTFEEHPPTIVIMTRHWLPVAMELNPSMHRGLFGDANSLRFGQPDLRLAVPSTWSARIP
jgi:hypothetical protein